VPKIVDHAQRRRDIVFATWQVIARGGLANATMREIAKEAGYSNGILGHYFKDRAELLGSALVMAHRGVWERSDTLTEDERGLSALRLLMIECLPLGPQGALEAKIEACFWGEAIGNPALMKIQNEEVDQFLVRVRALLVQAAADGELDDGIDVEQYVRECHVLVDGLSIQSVMYPERNAPSEQVALLDELLDRLRAKEPARTRPPR
jgi:AcrR family transcriptional regulator